MRLLKMPPFVPTLVFVAVFSSRITSGNVWVLQSPQNVFFVGGKDELERMKKVGMCILWASDKLPAQLPQELLPFPRLLHLLSDKDDAVVVQAFPVLIRAFTKLERQPVLHVQKKATARHVR